MSGRDFRPESMTAQITGYQLRHLGKDIARAHAARRAHFQQRASLPRRVRVFDGLEDPSVDVSALPSDFVMPLGDGSCPEAAAVRAMLRVPTPYGRLLRDIERHIHRVGCHVDDMGAAGWSTRSAKRGQAALAADGHAHAAPQGDATKGGGGEGGQLLGPTRATCEALERLCADMKRNRPLPHVVGVRLQTLRLRDADLRPLGTRTRHSRRNEICFLVLLLLTRDYPLPLLVSTTLASSSSTCCCQQQQPTASRTAASSRKSTSTATCWATAAR